MSHLTEQQVLECVAGEARPEWSDHIQSCPYCAALARELSEPLRLFAEAVREIAPVSTAFRTRRRRMAYWPVFAAVALLLIIAPFHRARRAPVAQPESVVSDEVLLQRVQTAVAESVPAPMAPLAVTAASDSEKAE